MRAVGTGGLAAGIVNSVVGAGIFSLPAAMAMAAGTRAPLAYLACALAMAAVVICFAEAGSRMPTSGGPYGYVEAAFGPLAGFVAGVLLWVSSVLASGGVTAALADAVGALLPAISGEGERIGLILIVVGTIAWINIRGVGAAARFISAATAIKLVPLALFLVVGAIAVPGLPVHGPMLAQRGTLGQAVILAFFAFSGMETPLAASGEVARPARTIPRALLIAMVFVLLLYVAIQLVAGGLLGPALAMSPAPLADAIGVVSPGLRIVILIGMALSMLGWITSDIFGSPRVLFAFARDRLLPRALAAIHPRTRAPYAAILTHSAIAATLAVTGSFVQLAILSALANAGIYFLACAAAWRLARRRVATFGPPLALRVLPLASLTGMGCMVALVLLARWIEIAGLAFILALSMLLFALSRALRRSGQLRGEGV